MNLDSFIRSFAKEHWVYLSTKGRYPGCDYLRAIAVMSVFIFHLGILRIGWLGVDLFFVISGFLIGGHLIDKLSSGELTLRIFYKQRSLRILPIYYAVILLCATVRAPFLDTSPFVFYTAAQGVIVSALFLQMITPAFMISVNRFYVPDGTWSLVIEEFFYLFCPLFIMCSLKKFQQCLKPLFIIMILIFTSGIFTRIALTWNIAHDDYGRYFYLFMQPFSRYDELIAGVVCALLIRVVDFSERKRLIYLIIFLASFAFQYWLLKSNPLAYENPMRYTWQTIYIPSLCGVMFSALLLWSYNFVRVPVFVVVIARLSYAMYLFHFLVLEFSKHIFRYNNIVVDLGSIPTIIRGLVLLFVTLIISYIVSLLIEYPFLRLYKKRFF